MQRYDSGTPARGHQGLPEQHNSCAHQHDEIRDLSREDSENDWDSDGVNPEINDAVA